MRISTNQFHTQSVGSIQQHQQDIIKTQLQLSTGKRINAPGDDPIGLAQVNALKETMNSIDQYAKNGDYAKSQLVLEETAITDTISSVQRARELAIQMSNDTYSPENRKQTASEIDQVIQQVRNMMNYTNSDGEKIFAGSSVNVDAAFPKDVNNGEFYAYVGSVNADDGSGNVKKYDELANYGSRFVQIAFDDNNSIFPDDKGDSSRVRITDQGSKVFGITNGQTIFTDNAGNPINNPDDPATAANEARTPINPGDPVPDHNILNVLVQFKKHLEAGEAPPDEIILDMDASIEAMSQVRAEIGGRQNRIDSQYEGGETFKLALEERRLNLEETDIVQAITDLTQQQNALQMAQQVFTRVQDMSLFNYLR